MEDRLDNPAEGKVITRYRPGCGLFLLALAAPVLVVAGILCLTSGQHESSLLCLALAIPMPVPLFLAYRVFEVTEHGIRIIRFGTSYFFPFEDMGRSIGTRVPDMPLSWTAAGTSSVNSYQVVDRQGYEMFQIGAAIGGRQRLMRHIREGIWRARKAETRFRDGKLMEP